MTRINQKVIKIINISEEGRFGGPARRIINVAKELKNMNIHTKIIMPYLDSNFFELQAKKNNVEYKKIILTRLTREKKYFFFYIVNFIYEIILLYGLLKKEKPDIVHINGTYQFKSFIAAFLSQNKIVWHLNIQKEHTLIKLIFDFFKKIKSISYIVASEKVKNYFIPNIKKGTIITEIHAPVVIKKFKQKQNYKLQKKVIIGTTTNLSPQKDLITFVRAAYETNKMYNNVEFHVGGAIRNSQKNYYQKVIKEIEHLNMTNKIKFVGFISDVPHFLSKLDIFLNSSALEGSPTAVWEALASGLPVVTTDVGSTDYYVGKMNAGLVSNVGDHINLAQNIYKLIKSHKLRKKYGTQAKFISNKFLNIERCANLHKYHYEKVLVKQ